MLSIDYIRDNKEKVIAAFKNKGYKQIDLEKLIALNDKRKKLDQDIQQLRQELNTQSKKGVDESTKEKNKQTRITIQKRDKELSEINIEFNNLINEVPNIPQDDVPIGEDESKNKVIKTWGKPNKIDFKPKDHLDLGEALDIIDVKTAAKVSGTRFGYLKNEGVILEFALVQLALNILNNENFTSVIPPVLINKDITTGLGYWQGGGNEDYYLVHEPNNKDPYLYLVGTAEHSIVPMHKDDLFNKKELPKRYVGFSTSFRREAGSYGKDTRGIFRVHQFDKIEMVSFVTEKNDKKEHDYLLSLEEKLFQLLEIPYQITQMCTGDLGFPISRKYDINAWMPSQNKYREVTSVSSTTDFQARRLNIKYQDGQEKKYVHILNGTAFAIGRTIIAILENHQQKNGSVAIPKALQKYTGFKEISKS